jgi:hypothetical protein
MKEEMGLKDLWENWEKQSLKGQNGGSKGRKEDSNGEILHGFHWKGT